MQKLNKYNDKHPVNKKSHECLGFCCQASCKMRHRIPLAAVKISSFLKDYSHHNDCITLHQHANSTCINRLVPFFVSVVLRKVV